MGGRFKREGRYIYIREGNGTPLQYSCLENPMDGGAWWGAVHKVSKNQTWLSSFTFTFHFHALEKEMATHSSVLAWRIPGTEEPGGLPSLGSYRVGHNWSDLAAAAAAAGAAIHINGQDRSPVLTEDHFDLRCINMHASNFQECLKKNKSLDKSYIHIYFL